jgi:hypothetical protein
MRYLPAVFALIVGVAGWFYLFYSRGAQRLEGIEQASTNLLRTRLRRVGGFLMLILGAAIYIGTYGIDQEHPGAVYLVLWLAIIAMLFGIVILGLIDLRLTAKLRRSNHDHLNH